MTDVVNLNQFRKNQRRAEKQRAAEANCARFSRTKAERGATDALRAARKKLLDGKKISPAADNS
ncbi:MAG: DUF4169 domain-containing protein [Rhodospirillaceae bacterium]|nr:DUF4169 domain-containing protein [Rhodospirillaceae bacterium]|tara:strand:- start:350 stop:541 length:192 start_codon:yes stop_codon:yes gene_type:complete